MILDFIYTIIIILIGFSFANSFLEGKDKHWRKPLSLLWGFHLILAITFYLFTRNGGGDAWNYWLSSKEMTRVDFFRFLFEEKGTYFIHSFNYIPANILGMSFFANTMLYALIGYIGFVFFFLTAIKLIPINSKLRGFKLFPLLFFLPNLHFWSSGVGKDALLFFCVGAFVYGLLNISKRFPLLILSILLSYLIRPHITLFLLFGFGLAYLVDAKVPKFRRLFFTLLLIGGAIAILPTVMKFANIETASVKAIDSRLSKQAEILNQGSGSGVDISSYPLPLKIATFLYRPFFFDINGVPALIASFENLLLLVLGYRVFKYKPIDTFKAAPFIIKGLLFFLIIGTLAFAQSLGNVGIMIRMRNMLLPGMLIYMLWAFSYQKQMNLSMKNKITKKRKVELDMIS